jgi:hypothetical protein
LRSASTCSPSGRGAPRILVGERFGDARRLADARDAHLEAELDFAGSALPEIGAAER